MLSGDVDRDKDRLGRDRLGLEFDFSMGRSPEVSSKVLLPRRGARVTAGFTTKVTNGTKGGRGLRAAVGHGSTQNHTESHGGDHDQNTAGDAALTSGTVVGDRRSVLVRAIAFESGDHSGGARLGKGARVELGDSRSIYVQPSGGCCLTSTPFRLFRLFRGQNKLRSITWHFSPRPMIAPSPSYQPPISPTPLAPMPLRPFESSC